MKRDVQLLQMWVKTLIQQLDIVGDPTISDELASKHLIEAQGTAQHILAIIEGRNNYDQYDNR